MANIQLNCVQKTLAAELRKLTEISQVDLTGDTINIVTPPYVPAQKAQFWQSRAADVKAGLMQVKQEKIEMDQELKTQKEKLVETEEGKNDFEEDVKRLGLYVDSYQTYSDRLKQQIRRLGEVPPDFAFRNTADIDYT